MIVTASNAVGSAAATSVRTAVVVAAAPVNTVLPVITGTAQAGQVLSASTGSWTGTPTITYAYQWQRCNTGGAGCANVSGATSPTYPLASGDIGSTIRVVVSATNAAATTPASSAATATVTGVPPSNTALPAISGTPKDGQTLSASTGSWSGTAPIAYAYQWESCNSTGAGCSNITGATSANYTVVSGNLGATIRVVVTATNAAGSASASSAATALVAAAGPVNIVLPVISGTTTDGQTLGASTGTWTGTPTITYAYQWQSCNPSGGGCANVSGATSNSYALHASDVGSTLRVVVTATNAAGFASATSAASAVIAPAGARRTPSCR